MRKIFFIYLLFQVTFTNAQVADTDIKAAMIERIIQFIDWSRAEQKLPEDNIIRIAVLGKCNMANSLKSLADKRDKNEAIFHLTEIPDIKNLGETHLLFICRDQSKKLNIVLQQIKNKDVVTIGDTPGFAEQGVMINFYKSAEFVRFEVNIEAIQKSRINLSSRFLRLARIVE